MGGMDDVRADDPGSQDRRAFVQAWARARGAYLVGLDDAADCYNHYLGRSGQRFHYDLGEACAADPGVRANTHALLTRAVATIEAGGEHGGPVWAPRYPETENWQKAVGPYAESWSAVVTRSDGRVVADVTVVAESDYRFASAPADLAGDAPDDPDVRFAALGMAAPFAAHGVLRVRLAWEPGYPPDARALTLALGEAA